MANKPNFDTWWKVYKIENGYEIRDTYNLNVVSDAFYACYRLMEEEFKHQIQIDATMEAVNERIDPVEIAIQAVQGQTANEIARLDKQREKLQDEIAKLQENIKNIQSEILHMKINDRTRIYR